ncbi:MAG: hypothetical protein KKC46_19660 [Proteobacteria bacterium]|nr:hypothetical protein [Pseudomonadota bacterium]
MIDKHYHNRQPSKVKPFSPIVKKVIIVIAIIWFAIIILFAITEPEVSGWVYFVVGAPLFAICLLVIYVVGGTMGSMIIDWIAETSDREVVKRTILNVIKIAAALIIIYYLLHLIGG